MLSVGRRLRELSVESVVYGLPTILQRLISFITVPIFTRALMPADYGVMGMMSAISALVMAFVVLGMDSAAAFYYYDSPDESGRRAAISSWIYFYFVSAAAFAAILWSFSDRLAKAYLDSAKNGDIVRLVAVTMVLTGVWTISANLLRIQRKAWWVVALTCANLVLSTSLAVLYVYKLRQGVHGIYRAYLIAAIPYFIVNLILLRQWVSPRNVSWPLLKRMLRYGLPLLPASLAYWIIGLADRFFLEHYRGLSSVGLFTIGTALASVVGLLVAGFQQAWGPFAVSIKDHDNARDVYAHALTYYLLITVSGAVAITIFAPEALQILTPAKYHDASAVVAYLAFAAIGHGAYYVAALGPSLVQRTLHVGWTTVVGAAIVIGSNLILIPRMGMVGAAISALLAHWGAAATLFVISQRLYPIPFQWKRCAGIVALAVVTIVIATTLISLPFWLRVAAKLLLILGFAGAMQVAGLFDFVEIIRALRQRRPLAEAAESAVSN